MVNMQRSNIPVVIAVVFLLGVLTAVWSVLLFPEEISPAFVTQSFETHETAMQDVAYYLVKYNISTDITSYFTIDENYGVEKIDENSYVKLVTGVDELLSNRYTEIISDGKTVEFVCQSTGGYFTKLYGSVI